MKDSEKPRVAFGVIADIAELQADLAAARAALENLYDGAYWTTIDILHDEQIRLWEQARDTLFRLGIGEALAAVRKAQRFIQLHHGYGRQEVLDDLKAVFGE